MRIRVCCLLFGTCLGVFGATVASVGAGLSGLSRVGYREVASFRAPTVRFMAQRAVVPNTGGRFFTYSLWNVNNLRSINGITRAADGRIWFILGDGGPFGAIAPNGTVTLYGTKGVSVYELRGAERSGETGYLVFQWLSSRDTGFGMITLDGRVTLYGEQYSQQYFGVFSNGLESTLGFIWFAGIRYGQGDAILRWQFPPGVPLTDFPVKAYGEPTGPTGDFINDLTVDANNHIWYAYYNAVADIMTQQAYQVPGHDVDALAFASGNDDAYVWLDECFQHPGPFGTLLRVAEGGVMRRYRTTPILSYYWCPGHYGVTAGPANSIWQEGPFLPGDELPFKQRYSLMRVDKTTGAVSYYSPRTEVYGQGLSIAAGADGRIWSTFPGYNNGIFVVLDTSRIIRADPTFIDVRQGKAVKIVVNEPGRFSFRANVGAPFRTDIGSCGSIVPQKGTQFVYTAGSVKTECALTFVDDQDVATAWVPVIVR